jgi:uncharacterized protein with GYD domain
MPTYVSLLHFTQKGIENIKESPYRLGKAVEAAKAGGAEMKAFYLTMGQYDGVVIAEAPSEEAFAALMLNVSTVGAVRAESLRAFTEDEYREIIAAVP